MVALEGLETLEAVEVNGTTSLRSAEWKLSCRAVPTAQMR
jgi:hypothetical protein